MKLKKPLSLEEGILLLQRKGKQSPISIRELLAIFPGKGRSLVLLLLSLPFCIPLQIPGFSTPFGIIIAFIGLRMTFGHDVWLPKRILAKELKPETIQKITNRSLRIVRKMKPWIRPRLHFLHYRYMQILNGMLIVLLGLLLALPLPLPLTNLLTAWPIFLLGLGTLEDDGIITLIAYFFALIAIAAFVALAITLKLIL